MSRDWSRFEVEAIVADYLSMLGLELAGTAYNKAAHRRVLKAVLAGRSDRSIEYKHENISAALLDAGFRNIIGYKPLFNYQGMLGEIVVERLRQAPALLELAAADADRPMVVPEVDDILAVLTERPKPEPLLKRASEPAPPFVRLTTNYLEREARNRSLGEAGETFILNFERARLIHAGRETLAGKIKHTSKEVGDHEGYDILSFEENGAERLIEVKTTQYGNMTPFFVSRNELATSEKNAARYQLYRLFAFREAPRLFTLPGAIGHTCRLSAETYRAHPM